MIRRRSLLAAPALLATPALAQPRWPERPVRVIVPYPPAGSTDVLTRILAESWRDRLGQPFVIENRPGAGGNIGADAAAKAAPDGYTCCSAPIGIHAINQFLYARLSFDPERDFAHACTIYDLPNVALVAANHPARTLGEFVAWAKAKADSYTYGSPGIGTTPHLSGELFRSRHDLRAIHVPFRGAAQTLPAMIQGDIDFALDNLASYVGAIRGGQLRALAVTSETRWPTLREVPTMAEAGTPDFVVTSWTNIVFPAATPRAVLERLAETQRDIANDPSVQQRFLAAGGRVLAAGPEEAAAHAARERVRWREVVRASGARAD